MADLIKRAEGEILEDLPHIAALKDLVTGDTILVKRGEVGYWPAAHLNAAEYNTRQGITPAQVEGMRAGSMFGFRVPAADPLNNANATDME